MRKEMDISGLKYVIFDWDNTLAESRSTLVLVVNQVLKEYNLPDWEQVKCLRDPNLSFRDNFPRIFGEDKALQAYERYAALYPQVVSSHIKTFPYVQEVLNYFKSRGIPILIMSNKDRRLLELELPMLFDKALFSRIVCGHEAPHDKPAPDQIYYTLQGLLTPEEITPQSVWMVGDSPMDSTAAKLANAKAIRIGCPIWGDDENQDKKIEYFDDFASFYKSLKADNT